MFDGYVSDGRPDIAGAVYAAPEGAGLPTAPDTALDSRFRELGYISEEGLTNARDDESIRAWGGEIALPLNADLLRFELLEIMSAEAARFVFGTSNVTGVLNTGLALAVNDGAGEICSFVVDMVLRSDAIRRIVVPRAQVVDVGDIVYEDDTPAGWEVSVRCLPDARGNYHYEYTQSGVVSPGGIHNLRLSDVLVQSGAHDFIEKPAAGYIGIGTVTVKGDANLLPENIREGVAILGVEGTFSGSGGGGVGRFLATSKMPDQTTYEEGDTLDLTGCVAMFYSGGAGMDVTGSCVFSPADGSTLSTAGTQTVTASYAVDGVTYTAAFDVKVEEAVSNTGLAYDWTESLLRLDLYEDANAEAVEHEWYAGSAWLNIPEDST